VGRGVQHHGSVRVAGPKALNHILKSQAVVNIIIVWILLMLQSTEFGDGKMITPCRIRQEHDINATEAMQKVKPNIKCTRA